MGKWTITKPYATTNLITNPSFETNTTGWAATAGATLAQTIAQQRRGAYSLSITPTANVVDGAYYGTVALASGGTYTASIDVKGASAIPYYLGFTTTGGSLLTVATFTGDGTWERQSLTWTATSAASFRVSIGKNNSASVVPFYIDGAMCTSGASAVSYFDGDTPGNVIGQTDFWWTGTPHSSQSVTSGQSTKAGIEVDRGYFDSIVMPTGWGLPPQTNITIPNAIINGAQYQRSLFGERVFTLIGKVNGKGSLTSLHANRTNIENLVLPPVSYSQPLRLGYTGAGGKAYLDVLYAGGLEGQQSDGYTETLSIKFECVNPFALADGTAGASLAYQASIASANFIFTRTPAGSWSNLGTGASVNINALAMGPDGALYAGGAFTGIGGVASTAYIAKWSNGVWSSLGGSGANTYVEALAVGPDGTLYAGGDFTTMAGVASTAYIAKYAGGSWATLGGSGATGAAVYALAVGPDGTLYAGGAFTTMAGVASTAYIAKYAGGSWSGMGGSGATAYVGALAVGLDGKVYAGGNFASIGGAASTAYIAQWSNGTWLTMGGSGAASTADALAIGPDGTLYAGGRFTNIGGVTANYAAKYNGKSWTDMGAGVSTYVKTISVSKNIIVGGLFVTVGGASTPGGYANFNGSVWTPIDTSLYDPYGQVIVDDTKFNSGLYLVSSTGGNAYFSGYTVVNNAGPAPVSPIFRFTGPGTLWSIRNTTTGDDIYFLLTLNTGETATLDLTPGAISFTSSMRGNIVSSIRPGSKLATFKLIPGNNNITVFLYGGTSASTAARVEFPLSHFGLDSASA